MRLQTYYTDNDGYVCQWIRNLIRQGEISPGIVDCRDIREIDHRQLSEYVRCHFFCGVGGWDLALGLAGWPEDREVWTGSCPCQPYSTAGKALGDRDHRNLWPEFRRLITECRPPTILGEQVASRLGRRWLAGVRADLEAMGYAVGAADLCAAGVGSPHIRQRLFWVAHGAGERLVRGREDSTGIETGVHWAGARSDWREFHQHRISAEPGAFPLVDRIPGNLGLGKPELRGMARCARSNWRGRLQGYGNAIVPAVGAVFIRAAMEAMMLAEMDEGHHGLPTCIGIVRSFLSARELGMQFGVDRAVVGNWLTEAGLCTTAGTPTTAAVRDGYCKVLADKLTLWHTDRVLPVLRARALAAQKEEARLALSREVEATRPVLEWGEIQEVLIAAKAKELGVEVRLL